MKAKLVGILGLLLLFSVVAFAQSTCPNPTVLKVGEPTNFDFVAPSNSNFYQFDVNPNRSYSVTIHQNYDAVNTDLQAGGGGSVILYSDIACASAVAGLTDTTLSEPALPNNAFRSSFVTGATVANPHYRIKVTNGNASVGRYVEVTVAETTKFSPLYTTFSGFNTFYRVYNTTSQSITGTMTAFNGNTPIGTPVTLTVPAYSTSPTIFTGAGANQLNVPANNAGSVIWVDNGPPAGTLLDGFAWNGTTTTFPIKFVGVRDK
jgi:hypothetical protein